MICLDPAAGVPVLSPVAPAWVLANGAVVTDADAAFCAGAALSALETLARTQAGWAGAWRERLALKCAAASMRLAGRSEDEAALCDADPGPAGSTFGAWRQLAGQPPAASADQLEKIVDQIGLHWDVEALAAVAAKPPRPVLRTRLCIACQIAGMSKAFCPVTASPRASSTKTAATASA